MNKSKITIVLFFFIALSLYTFGQNKINFFDRITYCLKIEKEIAKKLRGKAMGMISCGSDSELRKGFEMPFVESANYLGMYYLGNIHTWMENEIISESLKKDLTTFIEKKNKNGK